MVIDDEDRRLETTGLGSISSTKQGVGAASARKILNRGATMLFGPPVSLARDVPQLKAFVCDVRSELERHFRAGRRVLLEGTQGTLLSVHHGFWPHVTSRETTVSGCLSDAGIPPSRVRKVIMVVRTFPIRVGGNSGWMGREIEFEQVSKKSGIPMEEFRKVEKGTISGIQRRMDTAKLVAAYREKILLSPINSGSTLFKAQPRGNDTFKPIAQFPFDERAKTRHQSNNVVELLVDYSVPDVADYVLAVYAAAAFERIGERLPDGSQRLSAAFDELHQEFGPATGQKSHHALVPKPIERSLFSDGPYFARARSLLSAEPSTDRHPLTTSRLQTYLDYLENPAPVDRWKAHLGTTAEEPRLGHFLSAWGVEIGLSSNTIGSVDTLQTAAMGREQALKLISGGERHAF